MFIGHVKGAWSSRSLICARASSVTIRYPFCCVKAVTWESCEGHVTGTHCTDLKLVEGSRSRFTNDIVFSVIHWMILSWDKKAIPRNHDKRSLIYTGHEKNHTFIFSNAFWIIFLFWGGGGKEKELFKALYNQISRKKAISQCLWKSRLMFVAISNQTTFQEKTIANQLCQTWGTISRIYSGRKTFPSLFISLEVSIVLEFWPLLEQMAFQRNFAKPRETIIKTESCWNTRRWAGKC